MANAETGIAGPSQTPPPAARGDSDAQLTFDLDDLKPRGLLAALIGRLLENPHWWLRLLRRFWPTALVGNWALVTRFDDVTEVLGQHRIFRVPWGKKVELLNGGPNFLLGMEDDDEYWRIQKRIMGAFRFEDVTKIRRLSADFAAEVVSRSKGRLDAIQALITRVATLLCEHYYGVKVAPGGSDQERVDFANWTMAMSTYTFGDPGDNARYRRAALAASRRVIALVDESIAEAKRDKSAVQAQPPAGRGDVLTRLVRLQERGEPGLSDQNIRAYLIGMITGFVPTNTMAAGQMLDVLLSRREAFQRAQDAAAAGDDDLLKRCLFEAARFKNIHLGPFRRCETDYTVAQGTRRAKTIREGMMVLASTQSAMFDGSRIATPFAFDPHRPASDYLVFGHGLHWCIGALIAEAQIVQTLKALLVMPGLRRAPGKDGRLQRLGQFPAHLRVEFRA